MTAWTDKTDDALLEAIQSGSHHAFAILVERHHRTFYRLAYRYMAEREAAEDMVQIAFMRLWEKPQRWDPQLGTKFTTWFYRIMVNLCLDAKKKKLPLPWGEGMELSDQRPSQEELLVMDEKQLAVEGAVQSLPERQQTALNLCFYEELSNKEAADILQISVKALESLLMRAKTTLKEKLGKEGNKDHKRQNRYG